MARVTTEDCITSIPNRFQLVIYACSRARELLGGTEPNVQKDNDKFTVVALREIADEKISAKQREMNFRKLYLNSFDNEYISKFVLGRHWNKIDSQTKKSFIKSFNDYLIMVYAPKFKGWNGEFKTIGSQFENNMYIVAMSLVSKGKKVPSLNLDWRMYISKNGGFRILDVNIDGVSMLVTQRAEFSSVIKNHPKGVKGLIQQMVKKVNS